MHTLFTACTKRKKNMEEETLLPETYEKNEHDVVSALSLSEPVVFERCAICSHE